MALYAFVIQTDVVIYWLLDRLDGRIASAYVKTKTHINSSLVLSFAQFEQQDDSVMPSCLQWQFNHNSHLLYKIETYTK